MKQRGIDVPVILFSQFERKQDELASAAKRWEELRPVNGPQNKQFMSAGERLVQSQKQLLELKAATAHVHK